MARDNVNVGERPRKEDVASDLHNVICEDPVASGPRLRRRPVHDFVGRPRVADHDMAANVRVTESRDQDVLILSPWRL